LAKQNTTKSRPSWRMRNVRRGAPIGRRQSRGRCRNAFLRPEGRPGAASAVAGGLGRVRPCGEPFNLRCCLPCRRSPSLAAFDRLLARCCWSVSSACHPGKCRRPQASRVTLAKSCRSDNSYGHNFARHFRLPGLLKFFESGFESITHQRNRLRVERSRLYEWTARHASTVSWSRGVPPTMPTQGHRCG
jgi:hypothetical protein